MSIPKLQLVPQPKPQAEVVRHAPDTLDFTRAIIVNREQLAEALRNARHVSAVLHNIENLDDLSWEEMTDLCRTAHRAARDLAAMLETKEVDAQ
jgi:3-methyladenine DNA glycosylase Tag